MSQETGLAPTFETVSRSLPVDAKPFERALLYDVIHHRRDVRGEFTGEPVDEEVLWRILGAGHAAPSVGLSQPWDFIRIEAPVTRHAFWHHVQDERCVFASSLTRLIAVMVRL